MRSHVARLSRMARYWAPLFARFLSLQAAAQFLGFLTGLWVTRALPVEGFAKYSILLAVQGTAITLGDMGVSSAVSAFGAEVCEDPPRFSQIITAALRLRRRLEIPALLIAIPVLVALVRRAGGTTLECGLVAAALALSLHGQIQFSLYSVVPLLRLRFQDVQRVTIASAAFRLVAIGATLLLFRNYLWVIGITALAMLAQGRLMRAGAQKYLTSNVDVRQEDERNIVRLMKSQFVTSLYFAFEPQLTMLLISMFGTTRNIAEVGALGRLTVLFTAFNGIVGNIFTPRFARLRGAALLLRRYLQIVALSALFATSVFTLVVLFPRQILWLIGPQYNHLTREFLLLVGSALCNLVLGTMATLNISRAWNKRSWLYVPGSLLTQAFLLHFLNVSTPRGAILFGWGSMLSPFVTTVALSIYGIRLERARARQVEGTVPEVAPRAAL